MSEMAYLFDLNLQLIADAVLMIVAIFVLFLVVGNKLFNPIRSILQKRQEKIQNELATRNTNNNENKTNETSNKLQDNTQIENQEQ